MADEVDSSDSEDEEYKEGLQDFPEDPYGFHQKEEPV